MATPTKAPVDQFAAIPAYVVNPANPFAAVAPLLALHAPDYPHQTRAQVSAPRKANAGSNTGVGRGNGHATAQRGAHAIVRANLRAAQAPLTPKGAFAGCCQTHYNYLKALVAGGYCVKTATGAYTLQGAPKPLPIDPTTV